MIDAETQTEKKSGKQRIEHPRAVGQYKTADWSHIRRENGAKEIFQGVIVKNQLC